MTYSTCFAERAARRARYERRKLKHPRDQRGRGHAPEVVAQANAVADTILNNAQPVSGFTMADAYVTPTRATFRELAGV